MLVVALPGGEALSARLAARLRCAWSPLAVHRFPDGETLVRLDAPVSGRCVVLAGSLDQPDGKTLPLLFAADAARELGATQVGLVAPYLAYMRQDRRFQPGEAVTSRSYARLLSTALDFLVTVDPHLHRWHSLGELYPIRTQAVAAAPAIARWVRAHVPSPLLVGPDSESRPWVAEVAALCEAPFTVLRKRRRGDRQVSVRLTDPGPWPGCTPVLLDDIISTGHTVLAAAQALRKHGLPAPLCVAVHALFDGAALGQLLGGQVARVVSCDSITHPSNAIALSAALAKAVRQLATKAKEVSCSPETY
ncbi:MAG: ribose-phosphate pyrophosphokinase [Comamonadaceae bacterium]|nr:MAG: ribose-phosphate pyrophosphokinase [Comamonadaceae bacterium]